MSDGLLTAADKYANVKKNCDNAKADVERLTTQLKDAQELYSKMCIAVSEAQADLLAATQVPAPIDPPATDAPVDTSTDTTVTNTTVPDGGTT